MQLFSLFYGKSKKKVNQLLMTDSYKKCENYLKSREHSVRGFHEIRPADKDAKTFKKKSTTIGGNKYAVPRINRHGGTTRNGYVDKDGFHEHT